MRTPRRARSSFVVVGSLRRLFVVSRSCRARVASSSLSLLALRGVIVASTLSATRPPNAGNTHAARRRAGRGVLARGFAPVIPHIPLCVSVCAWPHRPLATGQRPCCLLWLAYTGTPLPGPVRGITTAAAAPLPVLRCATPLLHHGTRVAASALHHLHQACITCIKPASPAYLVHRLHHAASLASRVHHPASSWSCPPCGCPGLVRKKPNLVRNFSI